jgi:hypothetical protein
MSLFIRDHAEVPAPVHNAISFPPPLSGGNHHKRTVEAGHQAAQQRLNGHYEFHEMVTRLV